MHDTKHFGLHTIIPKYKRIGETFDQLFVKFDNVDWHTIDINVAKNPINGVNYLFFEALVEEPKIDEFTWNFANSKTVTLRYGNDEFVMSTPNAYDTYHAVYGCYKYYGGKY